MHYHYTPCIAGMFVGYIKFPSIQISTLCRMGNLIGVKILYVIPFLNKIVESELKCASTPMRAGVSSRPAVWGTTSVFRAEIATHVSTRNKTQLEVEANIFFGGNQETTVTAPYIRFYTDIHSVVDCTSNRRRGTSANLRKNLHMRILLTLNGPPGLHQYRFEKRRRWVKPSEGFE